MNEMDTDLLIVELLLRGFKHQRDNDEGHRIYGNNEVVVSIRRINVVVAARFSSIEGVLDATDYMLEKANGGRHD